MKQSNSPGAFQVSDGRSQLSSQANRNLILFYFFNLFLFIASCFLNLLLGRTKGDYLLMPVKFNEKILIHIIEEDMSNEKPNFICICLQ